jgi:hypothetical protein
LIDLRRLVVVLVAVCLATTLLAVPASAANKVPVAQWVNGVCETLSDWRDEVQEEADDFRSSVSSDSSVSDVKDQFVQFLDDVVESTKSMLSDLRDLGIPDIGQGSKIAATMRTGLRKVQQGFEDAHARAEDLSTSNRSRFTRELESISDALDKSSSAAGDVFDSAKNKYDTKQLDTAENKSPACKGLS